MRLRKTKDLTDYTIAASDADIGTVHDFYFDDKDWTIRYIVVETGVILSGHKVLISPLAVPERGWAPLHLRVNLTSEQVRNGPSIDLLKPISRQQEIEYHDHYGWPYYWSGKELVGQQEAAQAAPVGLPRPQAPSAEQLGDDRVQLHRVKEAIGCHVSAPDGEIGRVEDFLFDDKTWQIRYAIIDTRNWWMGKRVLISPRWIDRINWNDGMIYIKVSRDLVKNSPEWDPDEPVSPQYELKLHKHYEDEPYWTPLKGKPKEP